MLRLLIGFDAEQGQSDVTTPSLKFGWPLCSQVLGDQNAFDQQAAAASSRSFHLGETSIGFRVLRVVWSPPRSDESFHPI